jgi:hypothetical protein
MRSLTAFAVHRREDGAVAVLVAIMLIVFVAMVAIAVDAGGLYLRRRELVNGSDSAALSAGRTCARGGIDDRFVTPEDAADFHVRQNGQITGLEVAELNITEMTSCGLQWGHVSVEYTSEQSLFFAPALGFETAKPVTTAATASWGLGSNNPVPLVVSSLGSAECPLPPTGTPTFGQTCAFWYDNDRFVGGNFGFLSLNAAGWNVPIDSNCAGSVSGGTSSLTGWVDGRLPASVSINWTDPTYVCTEPGIKGVGGKGGANSSQLWRAMEDLAEEQAIRDFPISWEGPGSPLPGTAPPQGIVCKSGSVATGDCDIDKFDVIGFASLKIINVQGVSETQGGVGTCSTMNNAPISWTTTGQTLDLNTVSDQTPGWDGKDCPETIPDSIGDPVLTPSKNVDQPCCTPGVDYNYDPSTRTITWMNETPKNTNVSFDWTIDPDSGPCGEIPGNSSAICVVTQWQSSTLDPNHQPTDQNTVIRLCDFAYGTCLDQ